MIDVHVPQTPFDSPVDPVSTSGMLYYAKQAEKKFNDWLNGEQEVTRQLFTAPTQKTISGGTITAPTLQVHTVAAESGSSDDLDTITASNNTFVILKAAAGHTITIRHGVGNIWSNSGAGIVLTGSRAAMLWCLGSQWALVGTRYPLVQKLSSVDPGSGDDLADGYRVGSIWVNTTLDRAWMCTDATTGAALWKLISPWKNSFSSNAAENSVFGMVEIGCDLDAYSTPPTIANDNNNTWSQYTTSSSGVQLAGWASLTSALNLTRPAMSPVMEWIIKTGSDLTTSKLWFGLSNPLVATFVDTLPGGTKFIGLRYSNGVDTGWTPILNDGSSQSAGTTIGTVAANTIYKLRIRVNGTTAYFSVNDGAEQALSTNFPSVSQDLGVNGFLITNSAARSIFMNKLEVGW